MTIVTVGDLKKFLETQPDDRQVKGYSHEFSVVTDSISIREDSIVDEISFWSGCRLSQREDDPEKIRKVVIIS